MLVGDTPQTPNTSLIFQSMSRRIFNALIKSKASALIKMIRAEVILYL